LSHLFIKAFFACLSFIKTAMSLSSSARPRYNAAESKSSFIRTTPLPVLIFLSVSVQGQVTEKGPGRFWRTQTRPFCFYQPRFHNVGQRATIRRKSAEPRPGADLLSRRWSSLAVASFAICALKPQRQYRRPEG